MSRADQRPIAYLDLLRSNTSYRRLFFARMISLLGDWFHLLAILALLRGIGHDSAAAFAGVIIVKSLATFLVLPVAGVWADRFSRLRLMIISDLRGRLPCWRCSPCSFGLLCPC